MPATAHRCRPHPQHRVVPVPAGPFRSGRRYVRAVDRGAPRPGARTVPDSAVATAFRRASPGCPARECGRRRGWRPPTPGQIVPATTHRRGRSGPQVRPVFRHAAWPRSGSLLLRCGRDSGAQASRADVAELMAPGSCPAPVPVELPVGRRQAAAGWWFGELPTRASKRPARQHRAVPCASSPSLGRRRAAAGCRYGAVVPRTD